jgi:hypothetical protein
MLLWVTQVSHRFTQAVHCYTEWQTTEWRYTSTSHQVGRDSRLAMFKCTPNCKLTKCFNIPVWFTNVILRTITYLLLYIQAKYKTYLQDIHMYKRYALDAYVHALCMLYTLRQYTSTTYLETFASGMKLYYSICTTASEMIVFGCSFHGSHWSEVWKCIIPGMILSSMKVDYSGYSWASLKQKKARDDTKGKEKSICELNVLFALSFIFCSSRTNSNCWFELFEVPQFAPSASDWVFSAPNNFQDFESHRHRKLNCSGE